MGHYVIMSHKQIERKICFTLLTLQESIKSLSLVKVSTTNLTGQRESLSYLNKATLV
jgi:hypothetical protein